MKIAIASGKGGTGKTTVSTSLAFALKNSGKNIHLLDCDVEEPNCHIFVKPDFQNLLDVFVPVPQFSEDLCDLCGICVEICEANALALLGDKILLFPELCSGCGGCTKLCPQDAITEGKRTIGIINEGKSGSGFEFIEGKINVGEVSAVPLIKAVKRLTANIESEEVIIIDSPPGTTCPVIAAIEGVNYVVLVTEPTPFGLNDLQLAVEVLKVKGLPFGVVINRSDIGDQRVEDYCKDEKIEIIQTIPDDRKIAEAYSKGETPAQAFPKYESLFLDMGNRILKTIKEKH